MMAGGMLGKTNIEGNDGHSIFDNIHDDCDQLLSDNEQLTSDESPVVVVVVHNFPVVSQGSSWQASVFIIINAALGAGLLNFPKAFVLAGSVGVAMGIQLVLVALAIFSLFILAWCSDLFSSTTYQQTVGALCGRSVQCICSIAVILYCFFTCVAFLIIIGDQSDRILADHFGHRFCYTWYMSRRFVIVAVVIVLIWPFCYLKRIDFLKYASSLATLGIFYLVFLVAYNYYHYNTNGQRFSNFQGSKLQSSLLPQTWDKAFLVVPAILFGYQCHVSVIPVYSCLQPHNLVNFSKSVLCAIAVCVFSYSIVGIYGFLTYGSLIAADLWSSMDTAKPIVMFGVFIFIMKTVMTYPILEFCGREAIDTLWIDFWRLSPTDITTGEILRRVIFATAFVIASIFCGIFIPNISSVIALLGCLASLFILFFPGICLLRAIETFEDQFSTIQAFVGRALSVLYCVLGIFLFGLVFAQGIEDFIKQQSDSTASFQICY